MGNFSCLSLTRVKSWRKDTSKGFEFGFGQRFLKEVFICVLFISKFVPYYLNMVQANAGLWNNGTIWWELQHKAQLIWLTHPICDGRRSILSHFRETGVLDSSIVNNSKHVGFVSFWKHPELLRVCRFQQRRRGEQLFPLPCHYPSGKVNCCTPASRIIIMNQGLWWWYSKIRTSHFQSQHLSAAWTKSNSSNWRRQHLGSQHPGHS